MEPTPVEDNYAKFALVIDGEVAGTIQYPTNLGNPTMDRIIAALQSNPTIIEVFDNNIMPGWSYDGSTFSAPAEEI